MSGFKLLVDWLGPNFSYTNYPIQSIPKLHRNWELNTISDILNIHPSIVYQTYDEIITTYD